MDFFEGVSLCRADCSGVKVFLVARFCSSWFGGADLVLAVGSVTVALGFDLFVFVLNFWVFGLAVSLLVCCPAGRVGSGFLGTCLTVVEGILALNIFDFSTAVLFFSCSVAGDPAGNIIEPKYCRR